MVIVDPNRLEGYSPPKHYLTTLKELAGPSTGSKGLAVRLGQVEPGGGAELHTHDDSDHCFCVLEGILTVTDGKESWTVKAGQSLYIAPGEPHQVTNQGGGLLRYLVITSPITG